MPLQNRVDPFGEIHAVPYRGAWMGNRGGRIHRPDQTLTHKRWASKQWIYCLLEFKGWHRRVMAPRTYTELFFMDEVTALAAGHRPCCECQRERDKAFLQATGGQRAPELDDITHPQRTGPRQRGSHIELPDGAMFVYDNQALTNWQGELLIWSWEGFEIFKQNVKDPVEILTPAAYITALREGFKPELLLKR